MTVHTPGFIISDEEHWLEQKRFLGSTRWDRSNDSSHHDRRYDIMSIPSFFFLFFFSFLLMDSGSAGQWLLFNMTYVVGEQDKVVPSVT